MESPANEVPFTVKEAAAFWNVARSTVWMWVSRAKIESVGVRQTPGFPREYRFGDLSAAEQRYRSSGAGRPRSKHRAR